MRCAWCGPAATEPAPSLRQGKALAFTATLSMRVTSLLINTSPAQFGAALCMLKVFSTRPGAALSDTL